MSKLILIFLCLLSINAHADYESTSLPELLSADLIIYGIVKSVGEETFIVQVKSVIKGEYADSVMTIGKFREWTCAWRFAEYQRGQEELIFLKKGPSGNYYSMGAGNEGEMPVYDNTVFYRYYSEEPPTKIFDLYGVKLRGYQFKQAVFVEAIKYYLKNKESIIAALRKNPNYSLTKVKNPAMDQIIRELKQELRR